MTKTATPAEIRSLVERLYDHRTRRTARRKLVDVAAVDALIGCLDSTNESVVWSAIRSLGELRAADAINPLIELLGRDVLVLDVCEALTAITGQDLGTSVGEWKKLARRKAPPAPPPNSIEGCLAEVAQLVGTKPAGRGKTFRFVLDLPGERQQNVIVRFGRKDADGDELIVVYSECGPADKRHYEKLLRKNLELPVGSFAIGDADGHPAIVLVETIPKAVLSPRSLAKSILNIGARADLVERGLTDGDTR